MWGNLTHHIQTGERVEVRMSEHRRTDGRFITIEGWTGQSLAGIEEWTVEQCLAGLQG